MIDWTQVVTAEAKAAAAAAAAKAEIASRRYAAETAGIVVGGIPIKTDRESQALITGAALAAIQDPSYSCRWKTGTGDFITVDAATIIAVATAVRAHVQACFDQEAVELAEMA